MIVRQWHPDNVVSAHPHPFAVLQPAHQGTVLTDEPSAKAVRRTSANGIARFCQSKLRKQDFPSEFLAILSSVMVVNKTNDHVADILTLSSRNRQYRAIHENQRYAGAGQGGFQGHRFQRVVGPREPVTAWNQHVRYVERSEERRVGKECRS